MLPLAAYVIVKLVQFLKVRKVINLIPGPPSYYVLGNILDIYGNTGNVKLNILKYLFLRIFS